MGDVEDELDAMLARHETDRQQRRRRQGAEAERALAFLSGTVEPALERAAGLLTGRDLPARLDEPERPAAGGKVGETAEGYAVRLVVEPTGRHRFYYAVEASWDGEHGLDLQRAVPWIDDTGQDQGFAHREAFPPFAAHADDLVAATEDEVVRDVWTALEPHLRLAREAVDAEG